MKTVERMILYISYGQHDFKTGDTKPVKGRCIVFLMPCIVGLTTDVGFVRYIEHLTNAQQCLVMLQWTTVLFVIRNWSPSDAASHPRRLKSSIMV
jgi:hypothetical protein